MNKISETLLSLANTLNLLAEEVEQQDKRMEYIETNIIQTKTSLISAAQSIINSLN